MKLEFQVLVWHYSALSELTYLVKHHTCVMGFKISLAPVPDWECVVSVSECLVSEYVNVPCYGVV